ncbi:hypothetical protein D3C86_1321770 [compost metagenome]
MPTLRGWWMFQNTSTNATMSGIQSVVPHGIRLNRNATMNVTAMNAGLTGRSR